MIKLDFESKKKFLLFTGFFATVAVAGYIAIKYVFIFCLPFFVGFLIAFILKPISRAIYRKTNISRKICGTIVVLLAYLILLMVIWFVFSEFIDAVKSFFEPKNGIFSKFVLPSFSNLKTSAEEFLTNIAPEFSKHIIISIDSAAESLKNSIFLNPKELVKSMTEMCSIIPKFLLGSFFAFMSSIYISSDYSKITNFLVKIIPQKYRTVAVNIKNFAIDTVLKYIKAYLILTAITFTLLSIGLIILKINNPIGFAALIALCDAVPMIGASLFLVPWSAIMFGLHNFTLATGLLILCLIIGIVKNLLEPKILGKQLGIHPLISLISIYFGMNFFGIFGMIILPIISKIGYHIFISKMKN